MGGTRFIPIVIAGLVGLLIGWLAGPDIDDVNERLSERIGELQAPIAQLQTNVAELSQRVPQDAAAAGNNVGEAINALQARVDQLGAEVVTRTDALSQSLQQQASQAGGGVAEAVNALQARVDQLAADLAARTDAISQAVQGHASAPAAGAGDAATLAAQIGNTGAILLPGQSALYGGSPVVLSAISAEAGTATLAVAGGEPQDVAAGEAIDISDGCSVTLAGVAAGAAYLSSEGCGTAATDAPAAAAEAPVADVPAAVAQAPAAEPAAVGAPAAGTANTATLPIGDTAIFGDTRIFVSGLTENEATLFPVGGERQRVAVGSSLDAGDGCTVTVDSIADGTVTLSSEGCDAGAAPAAEEAAPAEAAAPAAAPAEPAAAPAAAPPAAAPAPAAPAAPAEEAATPAPAAAAGEPSGITTGQTASFGEHRVFLSGVTDTEATIYVVGSGRQLLATGAAADVGDGCSITLDRIEAGTAYLSATGC
ncbi:apolipoprotein A1/A4/E family protein [Aurantimonas sp. HBX-1]|uniref:apolipoprotein A1/A4/E family protein n=1 Tax=Aurantimonas sp. HBX-1 TaxID=2906072 RepID=UPI001F16E827|nr:apolipoprotein A1/A4/E family protein [Aurantimonas sp. HBX-1]UIJ70503.1 apolipoprotein A1/A4/E family protein [Aurantimonas sp. HBX-1]